MRAISFDEAKSHFDEVLNLVSMGKEIVITNLGEPIVRLSPVKKNLKSLPFDKLAALRAELPKMENSSVELIRQMRDEGLKNC